MSWEGYTISDDYLSISFEGMKEARKKIISSIDAKKAQRENISRGIESLQVPDSVLRGYGNDLIPIKNSISKDIDELMRMSSHIDYVMRRFEEVDNEYAARFKSASYGIQEKLGIQRENGIFGCCIAGLTSIVSQVTKTFSGRNNALEKKAAQLTYSSLNNKNTGNSLLLAGNENITAQAKKMYLSQESSAITNYSVNKETKVEDSKIKVFSESELRSLGENLNNTNIPWYVREQIKKYITDSGAMYYIDSKTGDYVVKNKGTGNVEQYIKDNGIAVNNIANRPKQVEFLNSILHGAVSEYLRTGIPWQVTMAQAAQETGWGDKEIIDMYSGESSNNLFGIKYFGSKANTNAYALTWTTEYIESSDLGYWKNEQAKWAQAGESLVQTGKTNSKGEIQIKVIQPFSVYSTKDESIIAHSQTLGNGRYDGAMQYKDDPYAFINAIAGTYATDDSYASSISSIMTKYLTWDGK